MSRLNIDVPLPRSGLISGIYNDSKSILSFTLLAPLVAGIVAIGLDLMLMPFLKASPSSGSPAGVFILFITLFFAQPIYFVVVYKVFGLPAFLTGIYIAIRDRLHSPAFFFEIMLVASTFAICFSQHHGQYFLGDAERVDYAVRNVAFVLVIAIAMSISANVCARYTMNQPPRKVGIRYGELAKRMLLADGRFWAVLILLSLAGLFLS